MTARRHILVLAASATSLALLGCASTESDVSRRGGPYCYRNARKRPIVCTSESTPGLDVEAEAKRFDADPGALTVYVVRSGWGDTRHLVAVSVDDSRLIETVPQSMVRMRLRAGVHRIAYAFERDHGVIEVHGAAGQVKFIRLSGDFWVWGSSFWLVAGGRRDRETARTPNEACRRPANSVAIALGSSDGRIPLAKPRYAKSSCRAPSSSHLQPRRPAVSESGRRHRAPLLLPSFLRQRVDDRAIGPVVTVAAMHEMLERRLHGLEFLELLVQLFDVSLRQCAHLAARTPAVLPQPRATHGSARWRNPGHATAGRTAAC